MLTVSQDMQGAEVVGPFFAQGGYARLEPWMDTESAIGFAVGGGMPTTVLYDAAGQEIWRVQGGYDWTSEETRRDRPRYCGVGGKRRRAGATIAAPAEMVGDDEARTADPLGVNEMLYQLS